MTRTAALLLLLVVVLSGCGVPVDFVANVPPYDLEKSAGYPVSAFTTWTPISCKVRLQPLELFKSEECYNLIIDHELRHCDEHDYHPNTPEGSQVLDSRGEECY